MIVASLINEAGLRCQDEGRLGFARFLYACAAGLAPSWSVAWFNRGLVAKFQRRWADCCRFNERAAELDPNDPPTWWNLGIAATALGDWETARRAWSSYGIHVPPGTGPLDMQLGAVPIRVAPLENPEVVWCDRLDPARARIRNVPTPECGRGCGDVVLHDGEPKGARVLAGREVPVFEELQVLAPGRLHTFAARVVAPAQADLDDLESSSQDDELVIEDWRSSIRWLCKSCSEGTPHEHPAYTEDAWHTDRLVGLAAASEAAAAAALATWAGRGSGRKVDTVECVLKRA